MTVSGQTLPEAERRKLFVRSVREEAERMLRRSLRSLTGEARERAATRGRRR